MCYLNVLDKLLRVCVYRWFVIDYILHSIGPAAHFTLQLAVEPIRVFTAKHCHTPVTYTQAQTPTHTQYNKLTPYYKIKL